MRVREVREHKINMEIKYDQVRVIEIAGEAANEVMSAKEANVLAHEQGMDLVEITAQATPPVVKVIDYSKFAYDLKKQKKEQKAKQHQTTLKEIRFGPNTDDHDFNFKLKHAEKFLQEGNKLKTFVQFRGRNIIYKDRGLDLMDRLAEELEEVGKVEMQPKMEGRRMIMIMSPK
ncbi:MAG: translation initiation factor IF-3 [Bacteroidia bacterium]|nr:translation initiation factor IF-3 [Bacteroidia bacterium]